MNLIMLLLSATLSFSGDGPTNSSYKWYPYGAEAEKLYHAMAAINLVRDLGGNMRVTNVDCQAPVAMGMGEIRACTMLDANAKDAGTIKIYNGLADALVEALEEATRGMTKARSIGCGQLTKNNPTYACGISTDYPEFAN